MYDEELVEDSLAFAKRLKEMLNEKQAEMEGLTDSVQPASSVLPPNKPETGEPSAAQAVTQPAQRTPQSVSRPQARPAQPVAPQQVQPQARPVQQAAPQQVQPQARPAPQATPQQVQPQARPAQPVAPQQVQPQARPVQQATPQQVQPQQVQPQPRPVQQAAPRPQSVQQTAIPSQPEQIQPVETGTAEHIPEADNKHTYEITIKFDLNGIKKKWRQLKEKLAPESRTLEEVNAAMEENRQMLRDREDGDGGADTPVSLVGRVKGVTGRFSKLRKREDVPVSLSEDGDVVDADITVLDGEVSGSMLGDRLEDAKDVIAQKASSASHIVTNIIILAFCIGIAYFFADFVTSYVAHQTTVEGESMEPTLSDGDNVIIQRLSYYFREPSRYDVVVFPVGDSSYDETVHKRTYYIKRVIGLPGETVQIIDGSVYINGAQLKDDKYALSDILEAGIAAEPLVLGEDQYFVMGDNRNMSSDSRNSYVGLVNRNDIVGEAWICIWPFDHFGSLKG